MYPHCFIQCLACTNCCSKNLMICSVYYLTNIYCAMIRAKHFHVLKCEKWWNFILIELEFLWRYWCRQRKEPKYMYRRKLLWKINKAGRKIENWGLQNSINFLLVLDVFRLAIYHSSYLLYLKFYSSDLWGTERG